ncbi:MAG: hypothetical protein ABR922_08265 [Streptosporangiaceae bacterium]
MNGKASNLFLEKMVQNARAPWPRWNPAPGHPRFHLVPPGSNVIEVQMGIVVIQMPWWEAILFFAAVILAIWGFMSMVGFRTRYLTHRTDRTAGDLYDDYAIRRVSSAGTPDVTAANGGTSRAGTR